MSEIIHLSSWRSPKENIAIAKRQEALQEARRAETIEGMREKLRALTGDLDQPISPSILGWTPEQMGANLIGWHNPSADAKVSEYKLKDKDITYIIYDKKCHEFEGISMTELIVAFENGLLYELGGRVLV